MSEEDLLIICDRFISESEKVHNTCSSVQLVSQTSLRIRILILLISKPAMSFKHDCWGGGLNTPENASTKTPWTHWKTLHHLAHNVKASRKTLDIKKADKGNFTGSQFEVIATWAPRHCFEDRERSLLTAKNTLI